MSSDVFRVLLIDDDEDEFILLRSIAAKAAGARFVLAWTAGYDDGLQRILACEFDAYLVDFRLGEHTGIELLEEAIAAGADSPIILLTGAKTSAIESAALQSGAVDFIDKQELSAPLLERAVRYAVERAKGARLAAALREQKQMGQVRERLIGIVGHDLRGPLASIRSAALVLHKQPELQTELAQRMTSMIDANVERMTRMIGELLDFTRMRLGGGIPIERRPIDAREATVRVIDAIRVAYPQRTIDFEAGAALSVFWDPERYAQVVTNLVQNALDYGDSTLPVKISLTADGENVVLDVHNHGTPIPPHLRPHLFDPFRRAHTNEERPSAGLGLGLFIVECVATGHGGHVAVSSDEKDGTRFTVTLPRTGAPDANYSAGSSAAGSSTVEPVVSRASSAR
jgi:signal transduction histidine kinase